MDTPDVSIVIACYNEESLLRQSVVDITAIMDASPYTYEIIFVDDASQDGTSEIIRELCEGKTNYSCILHAENVGRGGTVMDGIKTAKGKVAGFLDVDLEVSAKYIPALVSIIKNKECSVATICREYNFSWHPPALIRIVLSVGYRRLVNTFLNLPFSDTETGYKFFDRERIMPVIDECRNQGWFWDTEIMALSHKHGLTVREVRGLYVRRHDKVSTVKIFRDTFRYAGDLLRFRSGMRAGYLPRAATVNFPRPSISGWRRLFERHKKTLSGAVRDRLSLIGAVIWDFIERNVLALATLSVGSVAAFISYYAIIIPYLGYSSIERTMAFGLLYCEAIFANNRIGYVYSFSRADEYRSARDRYFAKASSSTVACLVPVCDEPIDVIGETIASVCAMRYEHKKVYILDDSKNPENIRNLDKLAKSIDVAVIRRKDHRHYKAGNINNALRFIDADYIAVFDADQRPSLNFLRDIVSRMDESPKLALVQTRQDYENSYSRIAHAAALQNGLFYEYICEGKDVSGSMFCCGTNFILRLDALREIGGFDVGSITEDFGTTLNLHALGWKTAFNDKLYATGLGPETLGEYFKQHSRWAVGTFQVLKTALKMFFKNPKSLSVKQWFDYWLSFSYYLSGPANFYLLLLPSAYILFGLNLINENGSTYLILLAAAFVSSWGFFLFSLIKRGYPARELITVCMRLETCKFSIYSRALVSAIFGFKPHFQVTEKGSRVQAPWSVFAVPLAILTVNAVSVIVGLYRLGVLFNFYLAINAFWAAFNVWQLSAIIQYNSGSEIKNIRYFNPFRVGTVDTSPIGATAEPEAG